jgi:hypothetical protein
MPAMGLEAMCTARSAGRTVKGKAHLDRDKLDFRGRGRGGDLKLAIPFSSMTRVEAKEGELRVVWSGGDLALAIGEAAATWADKIKNPKGRLAKLGIKPGASVALVGVDDGDFRAELDAAGAAWSTFPGRDRDAIFYGVSKPADLDRLVALKSNLKKEGAIWTVRVKGKDATVSERDVMAAAKDAGLVDVKVVAFSPTHTAEKLVIPVAKR